MTSVGDPTSSTTLVTTEEVSDFLNRNAWRYFEALNILKGELKAFRFTEEGRNAIYSVYSRGDRQKGGDELKEARQVKTKVNKMRTDGIPDSGVAPDPGFPVQDIGDIIAQTIVCVYPSDTEQVKTLIKNHADIIVFVEEDKNDNGYKAIHLIVGLRNSTYAGVRCELQIKTILHDAWSAKTHDFTYKPQGSITKTIKDNMTSISKMLTEVDALSESFKLQAKKVWERETRRRDLLRQGLLTQVIGHQLPKGRRRKLYKRIANSLSTDRVRYSSGNMSDIIARIDRFSDGSPDVYSSRLITFLACIREKNDLDYLALDHIDRWVTRSTGVDLLKALNSKGLALDCLDRIPEAIEVGEKAVELAKTTEEGQIALPFLALNLAYYLAELGGEPDCATATRATQMTDLAVTKGEGVANLSPDERDTIGYVKIVFGRNRSEIQKGIDVCQQAFDNANRDYADLAKAYLDFHLDIAKERLDNLDEC